MKTSANLTNYGAGGGPRRGSTTTCPLPNGMGSDANNQQPSSPIQGEDRGGGHQAPTPFSASRVFSSGGSKHKKRQMQTVQFAR